MRKYASTASSFDYWKVKTSLFFRMDVMVLSQLIESQDLIDCYISCRITSEEHF